jgi:hypothetical protein
MSAFVVEDMVRRKGYVLLFVGRFFCLNDKNLPFQTVDDNRTGRRD